MDSNLDFKSLWQQQAVTPPDIQGLYTRLKSFKNASLRKLIISNILLIATSCFIAYIWYHYQPQLITTKIGIVLTILAMAIFLFAYNKLYTLFLNTDSKQTNAQYLQNLLTIKNKQQFLHSTMLSLYFIMLSTGIGLYMYEPALAMTTSWAAFAYTATTAWILFNWFYTRPRTIKKQQNKLNELISKFEAINKQLAD